MAKDNRITLYDLNLASGCTISPFVWAVKYALAHKGFEIDIVPGGFTGVFERTGGKSYLCPAIVDDGHWVLDSWNIAEYLDEKYPDRPTLIPHPSCAILGRFVEDWIWRTTVRGWFRSYIKDYRDLSLPQDHEYITRTREPFLGDMTIEESYARRDDLIPTLSPLLDPLRDILRHTKWFGGETPNWADYRPLSAFLFLGSICSTPPLAEDDPLRDWLDRCFDLHGGLARHPGMHNLFGLKWREGDPAPFSTEPLEGGRHSRNTGAPPKLEP